MISENTYEEEVTKLKAEKKAHETIIEEQEVNKWVVYCTKDMIMNAIIDAKANGLNSTKLFTGNEKEQGVYIWCDRLIHRHKLPLLNKTFSEKIYEIVDKEVFTLEYERTHQRYTISLSWNPIDVYFRRNGWKIVKGLMVFVVAVLCVMYFKQ